MLGASGARGATYIDLRLPERPAAGGLQVTSVLPLAPAGAEPVTPAATGTQTTPAATPTGTSTTPTTSAQTQTTTTPAATGTTTTPSVSTTSGGAVQAPQNTQPQVQTLPQP